MDRRPTYRRPTVTRAQPTGKPRATPCACGRSLGAVRTQVDHHATRCLICETRAIFAGYVYDGRRYVRART